MGAKIPDTTDLIRERGRSVNDRRGSLCGEFNQFAIEALDGKRPLLLCKRCDTEPKEKI